MESLMQDLRYAARMLVKTPAFAAVAVVTLALGIGANTAIFTVVNAALLRSLPYREPDRLVHLWETNQQQNIDQREASYPDYLDWKTQTQSLDSVAGYNAGGATLTERGAPEQIGAARVTSNFFDLLGVEPVLGRAFLPGEDRPGGERIAILSHGLWQRSFAGDPNVLGQSVTLNGNAYTIVGVLPARFQFAKAGMTDVWLPLNPGDWQVSRRYMHWLKVIGRLKPGVTREQAQDDMTVIGHRIEQENPQSHTATGIRVVSLHDEIVGPVKPLLLVLLGAVGFVLLIACANVANLLLARAAGRRKEVAIRAALGASRSRLIRQFLTEALVLALAGGAAGLLWAEWGVRLLVAAIPRSLINFMPYLEGLTIDFKVLGFTCAVTLLTGVVFGLAPALQSAKHSLQEAMTEGGRASAGSTRARLRALLVISEVALALVLLVGAGLMLASFMRLLKVDPGFDPNNLLTFQLTLPYKTYSDDHRAVAFHEQLLQRIEALPGVKSAATVSVLPLVGGNTGHFFIEGQPRPAPGTEIEANIRTVSASYFRTMSIPLVKGRNFTEADRQGSPSVVMINRTLADLAFPDRDPIGQHITFTFTGDTRWQIVGVAGDEKVVSLDARTTPIIYFAYLQDLERYMSVVARTASDPASLVGAIRREVQTLDPDLPLNSPATMEQVISNSQAAFVRRYPALLIGVFAMVALLLAAIGIYGVVSYSVTQRTHEIGIRMALGARRRDVLALVIRQGASLILAGVSTGVIAALALTRFLSSLLFGVSATDPATFAMLSAVLAAIGLLACYIPARRATKVDPMIALRYE